MTVSTHVLDASLGRPAADVPVTISRQTTDGGWGEVRRGNTDGDGRLSAQDSTGAPRPSEAREVPVAAPGARYGRSEDCSIQELLTVCTSKRWAAAVAAGRPFSDAQHLQQTADGVWLALRPEDWLEALAGHPRIGEGGGSSEEHSRLEQAGVVSSSQSVMDALVRENQRYAERFGHVFLISAAARSASDILAELTRRQPTKQKLSCARPLSNTAASPGYGWSGCWGRRASHEL